MASSKTSFKAACVQLCAGREPARNVEFARDLIRQAAAKGADFVITPEQTSLMELSSKALFGHVVTQDEDPGLKTFRALAAELEIWLLVGSLAIKLTADKVANRSFLIDPKGSITATYDKIHMFDVDLPGGESYRESKNYRPGGRAVVADLPWGRIGLSICYDLRFAALYRALAKAGADFLTVPSAFTKTSGEAHWHVLQRARAIENGCYVLSPAQGGHHENGRDTFGHSMIVSPWGEILAEAGTEPGVIMADIDPGEVGKARARIPALDHDRSFVLDSPDQP
jgi:predicted amidohydrolase